MVFKLDNETVTAPKLNVVPVDESLGFDNSLIIAPAGEALANEMTVVADNVRSV